MEAELDKSDSDGEIAFTLEGEKMDEEAWRRAVIFCIYIHIKLLEIDHLY